MGEADFSPINSAIARGFHDGEQVGIFRIQHYLIESFLYSLLSARFHHNVLGVSSLFTYVYCVSRRHFGKCASAEISDNVFQRKDTLEQKSQVNYWQICMGIKEDKKQTMRISIQAQE